MGYEGLRANQCQGSETDFAGTGKDSNRSSKDLPRYGTRHGQKEAHAAISARLATASVLLAQRAWQGSVAQFCRLSDSPPFYGTHSLPVMTYFVFLEVYTHAVENFVYGLRLRDWTKREFHEFMVIGFLTLILQHPRAWIYVRTYMQAPIP
jgi:hypothetical protein